MLLTILFISLGLKTSLSKVGEMIVPLKLGKNKTFYFTKQDAVKASYADGEIPSSWVFDESKCQYAPPVAFPSDGKTYAWKESTKEWLEYPSDGKNYEWDNSDESWKERTE